METAVVSKSGSTSVALQAGSYPAATASMDTDFSKEPYSFSAVDRSGRPPLFPTFGSLLHLSGGVLTMIRQGKEAESFVIKVEVPPPKTPVPPIQPVTESPPRNGVKRAPVKLERKNLVATILAQALAKSICIIRSPPATGKTSLLDLTEETLKRDDVNVVKRLTIIEQSTETKDSAGLLGLLQTKLGVKKSLPDGYSELDKDKKTWILIDDAQLVFHDSCRGFWQAAVKHVENLDSKTNVLVIIAATYDLNSQGSTPIIFLDYPHLQDVMFTMEESEQIYDGYVDLPGLHFARDWVAVRDKVLRLSKGHVGVLTAGISELAAVYSDDTQKRPTEHDAIEALAGNRFRARLNRCFPCKVLTDEQRSEISGMICRGPLPTRNSIDTSNPMDARAQLVRAGILKIDGTFTCLLAQQQYFNHFYNRPSHAPENLEELIRQAILSMSSLRLRQSSEGRDFPKEAAFQQLFNEAMTRHLPPSVAVCPELNTFAEDPRTQHVVTGELDFLIDCEDFKWAVELLVKGDKIMEHIERFDENSGKYRKVGYDEYLVVDCRRRGRGGHATGVRKMERRCTIFFDEEFKKADYQIGHCEEKTLHLKD